MPRMIRWRMLGNEMQILAAEISQTSQNAGVTKDPGRLSYLPKSRFNRRPECTTDK